VYLYTPIAQYCEALLQLFMISAYYRGNQSDRCKVIRVDKVSRNGFLNGQETTAEGRSRTEQASMVVTAATNGSILEKMGLRAGEGEQAGGQQRLQTSCLHKHELQCKPVLNEKRKSSQMQLYSS